MVTNWKENQDYLFDDATQWKGFPFVAPQQEYTVSNKPTQQTGTSTEDKKKKRQQVGQNILGGLSFAKEIISTISTTRQEKEKTKQAQEATKQAQSFSFQGGTNTPVVQQKKDNTLPIVLGIVGFIAVATTAVIIIKTKK
jgi:hypothetical protein